jgi:hypothetical protein
MLLKTSHRPPHVTSSPTRRYRPPLALLLPPTLTQTTPDRPMPRLYSSTLLSQPSGADLRLLHPIDEWPVGQERLASLSVDSHSLLSPSAQRHPSPPGKAGLRGRPPPCFAPRAHWQQQWHKRRSAQRLLLLTALFPSAGGLARLQPDLPHSSDELAGQAALAHASSPYITSHHSTSLTTCPQIVHQISRKASRFPRPLDLARRIRQPRLPSLLRDKLSEGGGVSLLPSVLC